MKGKTGKAVASQQSVPIFPIPLLDNTPCYRVFLCLNALSVVGEYLKSHDFF